MKLVRDRTLQSSMQMQCQECFSAVVEEQFILLPGCVWEYSEVQKLRCKTRVTFPWYFLDLTVSFCFQLSFATLFFEVMN